MRPVQEVKNTFSKIGQKREKDFKNSIRERFLFADRTELPRGLQCDMEKNRTDIHFYLNLKSLCRAYL
jgi:hypothetical protein